MLPTRLQDLHELEDKRKSLKQLKTHCDKLMIRWYFKGTMQLAWNKTEMWSLSFSSLPASFLLFCVFFVKLLLFAHCADIKKKISTILYYLGMLLRNIELLRTPNNSISRKRGLRSCHTSFLADDFSSYCKESSALTFPEKTGLFKSWKDKKQRFSLSETWLQEPKEPGLNTCSVPP